MANNGPTSCISIKESLLNFHKKNSEKNYSNLEIDARMTVLMEFIIINII